MVLERINARKSGFSFAESSKATKTGHQARATPQLATQAEQEREGACWALYGNSWEEVMPLDGQILRKVQAIGITELPCFFALLARHKSRTVALCQFKSSTRTGSYFT